MIKLWIILVMDVTIFYEKITRIYWALNHHSTFLSQLSHTMLTVSKLRIFVGTSCIQSTYEKIWIMSTSICRFVLALQWRRNGRNSVSNHQPRECLPSRLIRRSSKLRVTGLCAGNSPVTGEFSAQRASNAEMLPFDDVFMRSATILGDGASNTSVTAWYVQQNSFHTDHT